MGILSNFIGGAAQAGGEILQRERESGVRKDEAQFASDLAERRERALAELRNQYQIDSEQRGMANRATERGAIHDETVKRAPELRGIKVEDVKATEMAKYDPEIEALRLKAEAGRLTAAEQTKLDFYTKNKTGIIGQIRDEARARHIDTGAGLRALQMESEKIKIDMLKADAKLPPAVKGSIAAIQKQVDAKAAALVRAELEGNANPEAVKKVEAQIEAMNGEIRELYRPYLGDKAPKEGAKSGPVNAWNDATGDVLVNGKVIGNAKSPAEAKAMIASAGTKPQAPQKAPEPARPAAPEYVPPPDSPAGKRQAAMAQRAQQAEQEKARQARDAMAAFNAVGNDPVAAAALQDSPLFGQLTREQKAKIFQLVRGR